MSEDPTETDADVTLHELGKLSDTELLRLEAQLTMLDDVVLETWDSVTETIGRNAENEVVDGVAASAGAISDALVAVAREVERRELYEE